MAKIRTLADIASWDFDAWVEREREAVAKHLASIDGPRVKEIRKTCAATTKSFERDYGISARTVEGWEQGRKIDSAARVLLTVIEADPDFVFKAINNSPNLRRRS